MTENIRGEWASDRLVSARSWIADEGEWKWVHDEAIALVMDLLVAKLNVDDNHTPVRYGIGARPTVVLFSGGDIKNTYVGVRSQRQYAAGLNALLR